MASNLRLHLQHCFSPPSLRSYFAEFISTFLFVFTAVGSAISARMLTPDVTSDASSLVATAVAQAFGLFAAVFIAGDVSGGHVNPAVTFAFAVGGHIGVPSAIFYWASQLLGSTLACLVLHFISAGQARNRRQPLPSLTSFRTNLASLRCTYVGAGRADDEDRGGDDRIRRGDSGGGAHVPARVHGARGRGPSRGRQEGVCDDGVGLLTGWAPDGRVRAGGGLAHRRVHEPGAVIWAGGCRRGLQEPGRILGRPDDRRGGRGAGAPEPGVPVRARAAARERGNGGGGVTS
ncbi:probable aquaporin TIP5-1 isoform X1 [Phragmites australis]|uniref:probable aquaporin TIP5-1 isoform X1 n=1 Tax=Phragmites australis TaxID=29695 RepID=UPI002D774DC6|nr:probable aquaporin TIP5-1 isoform X1 [Phragmites australis]